MKLDILIPTFQRCETLVKNLNYLIGQIDTYGLHDHVNIIVSDNASTDATQAGVKRIIENSALKSKILYYKADCNVGLEKNAVNVASLATADFILWCGDDDYLAEGYLAYVVNKINEDPEIGCIIPGLSSLHADGVVLESRAEDFSEIRLAKGYASVHQYSHLGHQMSGLVVRRQGLLEDYLTQPGYRNPYLFIYFVARSLLKNDGLYSPGYKTIVTVFNEKDWSYNQIGLLDEVFKSYYALSDLIDKRQIDDLLIRFMVMHSYRLSFRPLQLKRLFQQLKIIFLSENSSAYFKRRTLSFFAKETLAALLK